MAYLLKKYRIGRWLVENYPIESLEPYSDYISPETQIKAAAEGLEISKSDMPQTGVNLLHMTIVQKNHTESRWLLDFYRDHKHSVPGGLSKLLLGNATGKFFSDRNGIFYFGCFPLHFAVCSNDNDMFDLILAYTSSLESDDGSDTLTSCATGNELSAAAYESAVLSSPMQNKKAASRLPKRAAPLGSNVIFMRDKDGNNCLHLAVIHQLKDMYSHIKLKAEAIIKKEINNQYTEMFIHDKIKKGAKLMLTPLPAWSDPALSMIEATAASSQEVGRRFSMRSTSQRKYKDEEKANATDVQNNGFTFGFSPRETDIYLPEVESRQDPRYEVSPYVMIQCCFFLNIAMIVTI